MRMGKKPSVFIRTWGCTLNQSDSDIIHALLGKEYKISKSEDDADVVVLNSCTVKGATENKILAHIEKLEKRGARIVVAGCLAATPEKIRRIAPSAPIVGAGATARIGEAVEFALYGKGNAPIFSAFVNKSGLPRKLGFPIARIPIEEGCVGKCAFCQTKIARPFLFSYPEKEIVRMIEEAAANGAREVQLTGMDAGAYGMDRKTDLVTLLKEVLKIKGKFKIRLGMINPQHAKRMQAGLIEIFKNERMFKFLHMPVQTGSERVCRAMGRPHTVADFERMMGVFRREIPGITIATDVIAAYPGESETEHKMTLAMLERVKPDVINLSKFTSRDGTEAKKMTQIKSGIAKKRTAELHRPCKRIECEQSERFVGGEMDAVILEKGKKGQMKGRVWNYRQVVVRAPGNAIGKEVRVKIESVNHGSLFGKII